MQLHLCFLVIALLTIVQAHPWYYPYEKPAGFNAAAVKKGPARVITCSQANYRYAGPKLGCVQACQAGFIYVKGSLASKPVCNKASTTTATTTATTTKTKSSTTTTTTTSTKTKTKSKTTTTIKKTTDTKTVHHYSTTTLKTKTSTATTTTTTVVATATCPIAAPSQCVDPDTGNSNCFNFQTSNTNCGSCNNNCAAVLGARASTCQAGQCVASACYSGFSLQHGKCEITGTLAAYQTSNNALLGYATSYYYNNIPLLLVLPDPTMASVFTYDPTNKTMSADSQYFTVLQEVSIRVNFIPLTAGCSIYNGQRPWISPLHSN